MSRMLLGLAVIMSLVVGCSSTRVHVDYDRDADADSYASYAWSEHGEHSLIDDSPLMHNRIVAAIDARLQLGGLELEADDPDLLVAYHTETDEEVQLDSTTFGYTYGPSWRWDPYWSWGRPGISTTSTRVTTYTRGTLVVDIWDANTDQLVWRGVVEGLVPETPQRAEREIEKAIDAMAKEWQSMREGMD